MTPLNSIIGLSELAIKKMQVPGFDDTEGILKVLKVVYSSSMMMNYMNKSLLDLEAISKNALRLQS